MSLVEIAAMIRSEVASSKTALPYFKAARFGEVRTMQRCLRSNENVHAVYAVEGDHDASTMSVEQASALLKSNGLAALIFTTPSHSPDKPRWRVVAPFSRVLDPEDRERLCARLNGVLAGALAKESFVLSQSFFYGGVEGRPAPDIVLVDGRELDLANELDTGALGKDGKPYSPSTVQPNYEPVEDDEDLPHVPDWERISAALARIDSDDRDTWLTVGMALHHEGRGSEQAYEHWADWSQSSGKYDASDQRRVWRSFGEHGGKQVTIGTLYRLAPAPQSFGDLALIDPATWEGLAAPEREWIWAGRIPLGQATYFTGPGSAGKSLLSQQLATCVAAGQPMLSIETRGSVALYLTCEDDAAELHRRQAAICEALDLPLRSLSGRLHLASLVGSIGNEMATFDTEGRMTVTEAYERVEAAAAATGATFIILDNVAHLFAGNENIRNQAAAFVGLMNRLAANIGGSVLFLGHPNKAGQEYSGSTAWENQVRSRLFLNWGEVDEMTRAPVDADARVLTTGKANYGRKGDAVKFRWLRGAFVTDDDLGADAARTLAGANDDAAFLRCLEIRVEQGRAVSESKASRTYAPKTFADMSEGRPIGQYRLSLAMERLFLAGVIERGVIGRTNGKDVIGLRRTPADVPGDLPMTYPDDPPATCR
jgi:RecA-family ATPase